MGGPVEAMVDPSDPVPVVVVATPRPVAGAKVAEGATVGQEEAETRPLQAGKKVHYLRVRIKSSS